MLSGLGLACATLAACATAPPSRPGSPAPAPLTLASVRALPAEEAARRAFEQFADVMTATSQDRIATRGLQLMQFSMPPRSAGMTNVCELHFLNVLFEPETGTQQDAGPDTPARPRGFQAASVYALVDPPGEIRWLREDEVAAMDAACARLAGDTRFFTADNALIALEGAAILDRIGEGLRSGHPEFEIDCPGGDDCAPWFSSTSFADFTRESWRFVENCSRIDDAPPMSTCWFITYGDRKYVVHGERAPNQQPVIRKVWMSAVTVAPNYVREDAADVPITVETVR
jgi:hypothetical protein